MESTSHSQEAILTTRQLREIVSFYRTKKFKNSIEILKIQFQLMIKKSIVMYVYIMQVPLKDFSRIKHY